MHASCDTLLLLTYLIYYVEEAYQVTALPLTTALHKPPLSRIEGHLFFKICASSGMCISLPSRRLSLKATATFLSRSVRR